MRATLAAMTAMAGLASITQAVDLTTTYSENFDSMGTGTAAPAGWAFYPIAGNSGTWTDATGIPASGVGGGTPNAALIVATPPTANSGGAGINAGLAASDTDRTLGTAPTSNAGAALQLSVTNTSGELLTGINLGYDTRRFQNGSAANELPGYWLFYSLNNGTTWTNVAALNPTLATVPNTTGVTNTPSTLVLFSSALANNSTVLLRWVDDNASQSSPDQIMGLDNVSISAASDPSVALSWTGSPMMEAGGTATLTATLSSALAADATVNLTFTGTATLTDDYTRSGDRIEIPAGLTTGSITLTAVSDAIPDTDETIIAAISSVTTTGSVLFTPTPVTARIIEPQPGHIITAAYSGADLLRMTTANNGSPGGISTPGTGALGSPAGVTYLIQDGDNGPAAIVDGVFGTNKFFSGGMANPTAVPMGALTGAANPIQTSGWKWFNAHFTNPTVISHFVLRSADHAFDRTPDQFQLRGSNDNGASWNVIFRYDNNAGNGTANPWGTVVTGSAPPNTTAVQFDGGGVDFATPAAYTQIRLEIFSVTQGDGVGITEWQLAGAEVAPPAVTLSLSDSPMAEAAGTATVTATLSNPHSSDVTVNLAFSGTATLTDDYTRSGTSIVIPAGQTTGSITLTAVQDTFYENPDETIIVDIETVTNGTEDGVQQVTASIANDDPVPSVSVTLSVTGTPQAEAGGVAVVTATLSGTHSQLVTVNLATSGTATLTSDYTLSPTSIEIPAGQTIGTATITAVDDSLDEDPDETVIVDIAFVVNGTENEVQQVTSTITDDDAPPTVALSLSGSPMSEAGGVATVTAGLSAASAQTVTVNLAFDGTASLGTDYLRSGTSIVIPAGSTSASVTLTAVQDLIYENPDETIMVDIDTVDFGTEDGVQQVSTSITDDDGVYGGGGHLVSSPYSGEDLLDLATVNNGSPGGLATPGTGAPGNPAGVTYLIQDGDGGPVAIVDGVFSGNKFFSGGMQNPSPVPMGALTSAPNPTQTSQWKWFNAHFTNPVTITHFVLRTADHAYDRTPDQFQLRGSNDGGATWDVIYRFDSNAGGVTPWGMVVANTSPANNTAVQFDGGVDFPSPAAYSQIRLEILSATNGGDGVGITEWQLAGTSTVVDPYPAWIDGYPTLAGDDKLKTADPDFDGWINLLEFAFGTAPTSGASQAIAISGATITALGQPAILSDLSGFRALFGRRADYVAAGLTYTVQFSADLNAWEDSTEVPTVEATGSGMEALSVPFPPGGPAVPHFFRVVVSSN